MPNPRVTGQPTCTSCGKICYPSREAAVYAAARLTRRTHRVGYARIYAAHGTWHLTSEPKRWVAA